jgi:drug/metabolite transporter (DMT)-like permease
VNRQRPPAVFWAVAVAGSFLVMAFPFIKAGTSLSGVGLADALLIGAALCASTGYVYGARLARTIPAEAVICWACAGSLPLTVPLAILTWPDGPVSAVAWIGFIYLSVMSMWVGFFFWYRGLAAGGTVRVSQTQLLQPILGMAFSVPLLGETLDLVTGAFGLAIVGTVFLGRRLAAQ